MQPMSLNLVSQVISNGTKSFSWNTGSLFRLLWLLLCGTDCFMHCQGVWLGCQFSLPLYCVGGSSQAAARTDGLIIFSGVSGHSGDPWDCHVFANVQGYDLWSPSCLSPLSNTQAVVWITHVTKHVQKYYHHHQYGVLAVSVHGHMPHHLTK